MDTFTASSQERHPTDLAQLRGARLVCAQEVESGKRWDETKLKALTGGDPISARFMRQDFFTFFPQFSLFVAGNHRPAIRSVDVAIKARILLVPFTVVIPEAERDPRLTEKLVDEWPAIMRWLIDGCLEWQDIGLEPCQSILDATAEYMNSEDQVGLWLDECCTLDVGAREGSTPLFECWVRWCNTNGLKGGSQKTLAYKLEERDFDKIKDGSGRMVFVGLALRQNQKDANALSR